MQQFFVKKKEIIMYIVFGVLTTLVSWGTYTLCVSKGSFSIFAANLISWVFAVVFAYITNKLWVFEQKSWHLKETIREFFGFIASRIISGLLEIFGVPLLALTGFDGIFYAICHQIGIENGFFMTKGIYSKAVFAVIVVILNYILSKWMVFKNKQ